LKVLHSYISDSQYFLTTNNLQAQGPDWKVPLGRRDSLTANRTLANQNLPGPNNNLTRLKSAFAAQGLNTTDLVALSGIKNV
jgi:peroxidase